MRLTRMAATGITGRRRGWQKGPEGGRDVREEIARTGSWLYREGMGA